MIDVLDTRSVAPDVLPIWLEELAADLRPEDLDEIAATTDLPPAAVLAGSVMASEQAWLGLHQAEPFVAFGVAPSGAPGSGVVWMLGSPRMDALAVPVLRRTRPYLDEMHRRYPVLWNHIDARNEKSMRWLEWSGFRLLEALPDYGRERRLFFTFARYDPSHVPSSSLGGPRDHDHGSDRRL